MTTSTHPYNLPKPYLSASQVSSFLLCPKAYEFAYIHGIPWRPNIAMLKGTAEHGTYEKVYEDKIQDLPMLTSSQVGEYGVYQLEEAAKKEDYRLDGSEKDNTIQEIKKETTAYTEYVVPTITPLDCEREVKAVLPSGIEMLAYLDLIHINTETGEDIITDYKISGKKWSPAKAIDSLQFQIYSMITEIPLIEVHNVVAAKSVTKKPTTKVIEKAPDGVVEVTNNIRILKVNNKEVNFNHLNELIEGVAKTISAGIFAPCDPSSWKCSEKFCDYWKACRGKK